MDIGDRTVWQHAAGDWGHDHVELCLRWAVIMAGPAPKSWCEYTDDEKADEKIEVRRLCEEMRTGDIVVLKMGRQYSHGIGVVGNYEYVDEFNDIDGWDLGHARRVRWLHRDCTGYDFGAKILAVATTARLHHEGALSWVRKTLGPIDDDGSWSDVEPLDFTADDGRSFELAEDELAAHLFEKGLLGDTIRELLDPKGSFVQMANWYSWQAASEHEIKCHLVVPLLRVLGWTPQRIALEYNKIDVALFSHLPREDGNLTLVLEAKALHRACLDAFGQAKDYAKSYPSCRRIIVTDGLRYGVYLREGDDWPEAPKPYAYLNVRRLRSSYPIYEDGGTVIRGAKEAIHALTPEWIPELADL